jgi:hypothetical protein
MVSSLARAFALLGAKRQGGRQAGFAFVEVFFVGDLNISISEVFYWQTFV